MYNFEIKKGSVSYTLPFTDSTSATSWADSYFGNGYTITNRGETVTKSEELLLEEQIREGERLAFNLKVDVRKNNGKINPNFMTVVTLLREGELDDAIVEINKLANGVMSAELKTKYVTDIQNFLNNQ